MPPRPTGDLSNDDYVVQVLANEARDNSKKYALEGLGAYMPKKPSGAAPKPNKRFLRHIIRETDNHNAALKRKEEREARERMRQLREQQAASSTSRDTRRHRHRDRESDDRDAGREIRADRERRHRSHRRRHRSRSASEDRDRDRARRHRRRDDSEYERCRYRRRNRDDDERDYSRRHRSYSRSRSRSPRDGHERDSRGGRRRHERSYPSRSPSRSRSRSPERAKRKYKEDGDRRDGHRSSRERRSTHRTNQHPRKTSPTTTDRDQASDHDSDPLEDLVGPLPQRDNDTAPMRSRGRGAYKPSHSTIDAHFAKDYDPTLDVHPDGDDPYSGNISTRRPVPGLTTEDDDWELALEALRDRARWKQKGEERLLQAGFSESTVDRWKNNAAFTGGDTEGRIEDVKWSKKGEGREWDRGKVFDEDGHVNVKATW